MAGDGKNVISLFMAGRPEPGGYFRSETLLTKLHGQHPPASFGDEISRMETEGFHYPWIERTFQKYGQSGLEVSDLFPYVAQQVDQIAVIRSCYHEGFTHSQAQFLINNGGRASGGQASARGSCMGWARRIRICRGLWSARRGCPVRAAVYGQGFLPAAYQGTSFRPGRNPILNLSRPPGMQQEEQRDLLDTLRKMNEQHLDSRNHDSELAARCLVRTCVSDADSAPEATDVSSESRRRRNFTGG